MERTIAVVFRN